MVVTELESPAGPGSGEAYLETLSNGVLLAWTEVSPEGGHRVATSILGDGGWSAPAQVVRSDSLFVNWADFPTVVETQPGTLAAHWLVRYPEGGAAYRIVAAFSTDAGATWSEPWTPHEDGTVTEHGFVSWFGLPGGGSGMAWLDGRDYAAHKDGSSDDGHAGPQMTLRFRGVGPDGSLGETLVLDDRVCDCCQTAAAVTGEGPIVAYRDRSPDEIRDVHVVRWTAEGWAEPVPVHHDGWEIPGCPVNGPALAASDRHVTLTWFTGAGGVPRVYTAFSEDAGRTWGEPIQVDEGAPEGRVDTLLDGDGSAWVVWLERTADGADVRLRRVTADGSVGPSVTVAASSEQRASGFARMAADPSGGILVAWTDPTDPGQVRVARVSGAP